MPLAPASTEPPAGDSGSDQLLQLIFEHATEGMAVFDSALRLQVWNLHFLSMTRLAPELAQPGARLIDLLLALARAGEYGAVDPEAEAQRRLTVLSQGEARSSQRVRRDGRTIEMRRSPTPGGGLVLLFADVTERKAAEASSADQQRMLTLLAEHTEQGIWFIDNELRTTDANPAMCRMLDMGLAQMRGRTIFEFVDEANAAIFKEQVEQRRQGQARGYEISLRRSDGSPVHCFNNATPIFDAAGRKTGAVGMFSDISRLKRAEQQIRLTGELLAQKSHVLELTLDSLSQGVLSIDAEGRTNTYNRRLLELLEIPESMMQARPTLLQVLQDQLDRGLIAGQSPTTTAADLMDRPATYQRTRHDGKVLEMHTRTAVDGSVVRTYTDVTASVTAQEALRISEARFRTMADAAPALIWLAAADGSALWFNQRWLEYTGRSMQAELALGWDSRVHADDAQRCGLIFREATAQQQPYEAEFRVQRGDGKTAWIVDQGIPRFASDGRFEGFTVYGWDITERKAAQAALMAARDEAERANRAKSEFLSRMSHELRTPLNAVLGFAQLMQTDAAHPLAAAQSTRVQEMLRGGRHLLSLINDVLDLARIEAGALHLELAPVDLAAVVEDSLRLVRAAAAERGLTLSVEPGGEGAGWVLADPTRLTQVLLNLLSNAVKYNRDAGQVRLRWFREPGGNVRIEVHDTGHGLSAAQQERLFHAFERLDAARGLVEGAGIGLALSKWLVDLMQGQIGVHSTPGVGSVFWVSLVHAEAEAEAEVEAAAPRATALLALAAPGAGPARTVLYIEDNEVNRILMEGMLALRPAIRLLLAPLPQAGLTLAEQERPDLVLLDIQLPGIDGFEVLRRLRAQQATRQIRVVAVSANAMPADRDKARDAGFDGYITKPVDLLNLLALVDRLLAPQDVPGPAPGSGG